MDSDSILRRAWQTFRENFYLISLGVVLSLIVSIVLFWIGYQLLGKDWVVIFLVNSFLLGGIYVASRTAIEAHVFEDASVILARYILAFSVLSLLVVASILIPYPWNVIFLLIVASLGYFAVPIVAELGIVEGLRRVASLLRERPVTYIGLNWLFLLAFLAIVSLFINEILTVLGFIALLFLYYPLYSLTAYYLAKEG